MIEAIVGKELQRHFKFAANMTSSEGSIEFELSGNLTFAVATED
ncbi:MAG: hypothetical protein WAO22_09100 [bacterium]|jgi:dolichol kinase